MAADDLTRPLGLGTPKAPRARARRLRLAGAGAILLAAVAAAWFVLAHDPEAGGSAIIAGIDDRSAAVAGGAGTTGAIARTPGKLSSHTPETTGLTEIISDGTLSDIGRDVVVIGNPDDPEPVQLAAAPLEELVEDGPEGLLPRIGPDGMRPIDAYARPVDPAASGAARIAIVVGGIGIADAGTEDAITHLPGAVTLAFAPYGKDLPDSLARARAAGHEILLQVPLEPFGYPNNDPGPHTLTVTASPEENIDRLHWLMSRITTYVGVVNYLGARFTSDEAALAPVLAEIGRRGLLYLDDGSSGMSRADRLAKGMTAFARADVVLDPVTEAEAIDERLARVAAIARERGYAIATATAFPVTIERIIEFVRTAEERGIEIVPVTALVDTERT